VHHRIRTQSCPFADLIIVVFENPDSPAAPNSPYWEYSHRLPPTRLRRPQIGRSSTIYHGDRAAAFLPHYPPVPTEGNDRDPGTRPPRADHRTHGRPAARGGRGSAGSGSGRVRLEKQIVAAGALLDARQPLYARSAAADERSAPRLRGDAATAAANELGGSPGADHRRWGAGVLRVRHSTGTYRDPAQGPEPVDPRWTARYPAPSPTAHCATSPPPSRAEVIAMNFLAATPMDAGNGPVSDRAPSPRRTARGRATTRESGLPSRPSSTHSFLHPVKGPAR
jgi:hypothetical protein